MAGQSCYVPLGRHLVSRVIIAHICQYYHLLCCCDVILPTWHLLL